MKNKLIECLWKHLKMTEGETLVVKVYNPKKNADEYKIVTSANENLQVVDKPCEDKTLEEIPKGFRLIVHRDSSGYCKTPSILELEKEKMADY